MRLQLAAMLLLVPALAFGKPLVAPITAATQANLASQISDMQDTLDRIHNCEEILARKRVTTLPDGLLANVGLIEDHLSAVRTMTAMVYNVQNDKFDRESARTALQGYLNDEAVTLTKLALEGVQDAAANSSDPAVVQTATKVADETQHVIADYNMLNLILSAESAAQQRMK